MARSYSVLLIDDDPGLRMLVRLLLEHEGHRVLLAPDGEIGLALAQGERPECILLDMAMPRRNGMDVYLDLQNSSASGIPPTPCGSPGYGRRKQSRSRRSGCAG